MPTAGRLFAAFAMAIVGYMTAEDFKPQMPEGTVFGFFSIASALIGLVVGWRTLGPDVSRPGAALGSALGVAINAGLKAAIVLVLWALLIFSFEEMIQLAFRKTYKSPMEAIVGVVQLALGFAERMLVVDVLSVVAVGSIIAAWLAVWAARRWH